MEPEEREEGLPTEEEKKGEFGFAYSFARPIPLGLFEFVPFCALKRVAEEVTNGEQEGVRSPWLFRKQSDPHIVDARKGALGNHRSRHEGVHSSHTIRTENPALSKQADYLSRTFSQVSYNHEWSTILLRSFSRTYFRFDFAIQC